MKFIILKEPGEGTSINRMWDTMLKLSEERKEELERQGHKAMVIPSGCVSPEGWVSYVLAFKEIMEQCEEMGITLDYLFHTAGTGGSLPGMIAGKLLLGSDTKIISIAINPYGPDEICNEDIICDRVKYVFEVLKLQPPKKEDILKEINIDQNYIGEDYGVPSEEGSAAIMELAREEALFTDSVYTGKGFAGFLDYVRTGKVTKTSKVAFLHTGGTGALFAERGLTGRLFKPKSTLGQETKSAHENKNVKKIITQRRGKNQCKKKTRFWNLDSLIIWVACHMLFLS